MNNENHDASALLLLQELTSLEVNYWYDVDHNWGMAAHSYYVADAQFRIGDKTMRGVEAIADFYKWRQGRGDRTARHVVTNFRLAAVQGARASFDCILNLFAADGRPPLPSEPAIMIADIHSECERGQDGLWRFRSHTLVPIFTGSTPATIPPV
jgi:SnoaL-like domain